MQRAQDAAGIVVMDAQKRVLLVHQTYGKRVWALPGGMVEEGESAWQAAARELKEETDIAVPHMELSGLYFQPHKNRYIFTFTATEYEGEIKVDQKEIDQYGFFDLDHLPKPISSFTIQRLIDAVTSKGAVYKEETLDTYRIVDDAP
ncbi:NUDIX hydrolase [Paenibacillus ginsengarvi]|uniref:NUDIX domain-containing protein n=1 Tax=Paenibacillus ginsengarvi TaxID=400777 RepID=A0A3B0CGZ7_9BACL|nr:NUDIX domain-containing protein [Paenibacillus ginsengarvi]RKN84098.1 NUDIX domain-containing protein [Paenibacillus ginsengarvi]